MIKLFRFLKPWRSPDDPPIGINVEIRLPNNTANGWYDKSSGLWVWHGTKDPAKTPCLESQKYIQPGVVRGWRYW